jgi:hypothetical protein
LIHPKYNSQLDVVALTIQNYADMDMYGINMIENMELAPQIGRDVFIIGFPFGIRPGGFPS